MAARSIATLSLTFGLVSIPVKLYSATESSAAIRFRLMSAGGARVRQQYVSDEPAAAAEPPPPEAEEEEEAAPPTPGSRGGAASRVLDFPSRGADTAPSSMRTSMPTPHPPPSPEPAVIERSEMVKGYEFEKGRFVLFTPEQLKALADASRQTIDIVEFIPERAIDPIYFDKAYFLAPDKRGSKPYSLLLRAMQDSGRSALAKWAFRAKEYVVQIRAAGGGMVLQQLLYADEVRSLSDLDIGLVPVGEAELKLARQLIEQISAEAYDPTRFVDEEKQRILAAVERKIAGRQVVAPAHRDARGGAEVVDLVAALRASLQAQPASSTTKPAASATGRAAMGERKPVKRAASSEKDSASTKRPTRKR